MAHPYAGKMQGGTRAKAICKADGGSVKMAGDLIDTSDNFRNIQQSNAISRVLKPRPGSNDPKAPVVPIKPKAG